MENFLIDNTARFQELVDAHNLKAHKDKLTAAKAPEINPDAAITIAARLRPLLEDEVSSGQIDGVFERPGTTGTVDLHEMRRPVKPAAPPVLTSSTYGVDRVFGPANTTDDIYHDLVRPLVPWAWSGGVSTLFAYGQTGSGKTFTVSGLERAIAQTLFTSSPDLEGTRNIYISIIELSGKNAFDLLTQRKPVSILEDSFGSTHFAGASDFQVPDAETLLKHIEDAAAFRRTEPTLKNNTSSRSHAICKIRLVNPELPQADEGVLYLIDLAGSEAARDKSAHSAERMKEAREINTSLSVLKDCIRGRAGIDIAATNNRVGYVPFRQSSLTRVLKHVFDPAAERSCKTLVIACINPSFLDVGASKSTLRYGALLKGTPPKPAVVGYDPVKPSSWNHEQLQEWISKSSGTPAVSADLLAPVETGKQLLRVPAPEFILRCLKTDGVTKEQAIAFHSKFWSMHIDSARSTTFKKPANGNKSESGKATPGGDSAAIIDSTLDKQAKGLCSSDPRVGVDTAKVPFKERLRPGMVVSWDPSEVVGVPKLEGRNLAILLAPEGDDKWTSGMVAPGLLPGSYELYVWHQFVAPVDKMLAEVVLEYDLGSRYYYEMV